MVPADDRPAFQRCHSCVRCQSKAQSRRNRELAVQAHKNNNTPRWLPYAVLIRISLIGKQDCPKSDHRIARANREILFNALWIGEQKRAASLRRRAHSFGWANCSKVDTRAAGP